MEQVKFTPAEVAEIEKAMFFTPEREVKSPLASKLLVENFMGFTGVGIPRFLFENRSLAGRDAFFSNNPELLGESNGNKFFEFALKNDDFFSFGLGGARTLNTYNVYYSCPSFAYELSVRYYDDLKKARNSKARDAVAHGFENLEKLIAEPPHEDFKVMYRDNGLLPHPQAYRYDPETKEFVSFK
ncbi:MAG: hypothetical protein LBJ94_03605 [Puniceicoccales bacterium]|jgi:hypothetical protein|nr:hypothetical protein [Puniceicoccales bacterium]